METQLFQNLASASPIAGILIVIAWWFKQMSERYYEALDAERKDRIAKLETTVDKLDKRSSDCEKDRAVMHQDLRILKECSGLKFPLVKKEEE